MSRRRRPAGGFGPGGASVGLSVAILVGCALACAPAAPASPAASGGPRPVAAAPQGAVSAASGVTAPPEAPGIPPAESRPAGPPLRVVLNWTQPSGSMSPIWVGQEAGYFREEGLDVELLNIANTSRVLQTMAAGEVHVSPLDPQTVVRSGLGGFEVVLLFAQTNQLTFGLFGQPGTTDVQQLRGKVVGTTRVGASNHTATVFALERAGLAPDRDVGLRQLGEVSAIYAALQAGQVDGATLGLPLNRAIVPGLVELVNLARDGPEYPSIVTGAPRAWVQANDEAVRRLARGFVRGIHRFKQDKGYSVEVYRKYYQSDDTAYLGEAWEVFRQFIPDAPYVSEAGFARILQGLAEDEPRVVGRQPSEWLDQSYVRELDESGFIRGLSGAPGTR